jgi:hypothetical protein
VAILRAPSTACASNRSCLVYVFFVAGVCGPESFLEVFAEDAVVMEVKQATSALDAACLTSICEICI